ncbi:MAG TPA: DUF6011 domain-containing protein [Trebonia sp.]|nr:DUF6011 domain-containing protein [Trebonia sp.]
MTSTDTTQTRECLGCGRTLRSAAAVARGYGSGCWAKVRKAERAADLSAWAPRQIEQAAELIEDGGVVPPPSRAYSAPSAATGPRSTSPRRTGADARPASRAVSATTGPLPPWSSPR